MPEAATIRLRDDTPCMEPAVTLEAFAEQTNAVAQTAATRSARRQAGGARSRCSCQRRDHHSSDRLRVACAPVLAAPPLSGIVHTVLSVTIRYA